MADAYGDTKEIEKVSKRRTGAIGLSSDGSYSVAVTSRRNSFAYSGIYSGDYATASGRDIVAATRAAVRAEAFANGNYAEARAYASANAKSRSSGGHDNDKAKEFLSGQSNGGWNKGGWAEANSKAKSFARVQVTRTPRQRTARVACEQWRKPRDQILYCDYWRDAR